MYYKQEKNKEKEDMIVYYMNKLKLFMNYKNLF